ncbi:helix-turn-helix domain-containing protein [Streptococcus pneumoniae]|uniref:helix-turn-helix domain-containing protein n=1 Tax=Streptococcus pneumoniae TaxID=1313 RepID=UPI001CB777DD
MSESYCSNLFVRILNINFKDYYTSLKINHAIRLLICTNDSITSISEQSGFSSHTNFTNQFKNYHMHLFLSHIVQIYLYVY